MLCKVSAYLLIMPYAKAPCNRFLRLCRMILPAIHLTQQRFLFLLFAGKIRTPGQRMSRNTSQTCPDSPRPLFPHDRCSCLPGPASGTCSSPCCKVQRLPRSGQTFFCYLWSGLRFSSLRASYSSLYAAFIRHPWPKISSPENYCLSLPYFCSNLGNASSVIFTLIRCTLTYRE